MRGGVQPKHSAERRSQHLGKHLSDARRNQVGQSEAIVLVDLWSACRRKSQKVVEAWCLHKIIHDVVVVSFLDGSTWHSWRVCNCVIVLRVASFLLPFWKVLYDILDNAWSRLRGSGCHRFCFVSRSSSVVGNKTFSVCCLERVMFLTGTLHVVERAVRGQHRQTKKTSCWNASDNGEEAQLYAWVEEAHREGLEKERDAAERRARRAEKKAAKKKKQEEKKKKRTAKRRGTQDNSSLLGLSFLASLSLEVLGRRLEWARRLRCRHNTRGGVNRQKRQRQRR